jgi:hypothetical protein
LVLPERFHDTDAAGQLEIDEDGSEDGHRWIPFEQTGAKGVRTMKLDEEHRGHIISVRTIPDLKTISSCSQSLA